MILQVSSLGQGSDDAGGTHWEGWTRVKDVGVLIKFSCFVVIPHFLVEEGEFDRAFVPKKL